MGATLSTLRRGGGDPTHRLLAERGGVARDADAGRPGAAAARGAAGGRRGRRHRVGRGRGVGAGRRPRPARRHATTPPASSRCRSTRRWSPRRRAAPGWRVPRTRAVFEALAASALEQRVTGKEAFAAWRTLVRRYGEPAPGPFGAVLGMSVPPAPEVWRQIPSLGVAEGGRGRRAPPRRPGRRAGRGPAGADRGAARRGGRAAAADDPRRRDLDRGRGAPACARRPGCVLVAGLPRREERLLGADRPRAGRRRLRAR